MTITSHTRRAVRKSRDDDPRGVLSGFDRKRRSIRFGIRLLYVVVFFGLVVACLGPLLWLAKAAVSTTQDTLTQPFALWPSGVQWHNLFEAWTELQVATYLLNTIWVAGGSAITAVLVATTGGYALSVLRPKYARILSAGVMATLFIPGVVYLVPLYLTVLDVPIVHVNLLNSYWAVWLPAGTAAFGVLLVKRFMDRLPRDLIDAARVDGAGLFRVFRSIVLPMTRPIIGVLALLSFMGGWEAFLWPLLVLPDINVQPISVALPRLALRSEESTLMAALFISVIIPILLFLVFQRHFLRAASQAGALRE